MSNKESNVVLNFKMDGQVQYATTIKDINQVMNIAAKEYKAHVAAMGNDASATEKLSAAKKKLEIQLEGAQKRTQILREEYERMAQDTNVSTEALNKQYGKLVDAERAEASLSNQLDKTNQALVEQHSETIKNQQALEGLKQEESELDAESKKLTSEFKLQQSELGENASEADKLALAHDHLEKQMDLTEKQIKNMEQQLEITKAEYGENSIEANKMETELNEAKLAFNNLGDEMNNLHSDSKNAAGGMEELTATVKAEAFMQASEKIAELSQKIVELGQYALEAFREVDDGADIVASKTGATGEQLDSLTGSFKNLSSRVPDDFGAVGEAIGEVNTQFSLLGDELERESDQILQFATITGQDVTSATIDAKQSIEAYRLETSDLDMVLDSVAKTAQNTGQSSQDLFKKVIAGAPQIKMLNLRFDEGVALMGQLEKSGVDSSAALSSLGKASIVYAKDGKSLEKGLAETIKKIKGAKSETDALTIASEVFGSKGAVRMVDAIKRGTFNLDAFGNSAKESSGTVNRTFNDMLDPIDNMDIASNNLKLTFSDFGNSIAEVLTPVLEVLNKIMQGINLLPTPFKTVIVVIGLLVVAFGALLPFIASFAVMAATAEMTMAGLAASMLPVIGIIAGIVAAIALLVTGFMWLWNNVEGFRNFWMDLWKSIQNAFTAAWNYIQPGLKSIADALRKFWEEYSPLLMAAVKMIGDKIAEFIRYIEPYWKFFWQNVGSTLKFVWDVIVATVKFALNLIGGLIDIFVGLFTGDWDRMAKGINRIWSSLWEFVGSILSSAKDTVVSKLHSLVDFANSIIQGMRDGIKDKFDAIYNFMTDPIGNAKDFIWDILQDIMGFFDSLDLSFPEIKMPKLPHFSLDGEFSLKNMTVPSLSVDWRAKGAIFTQPTIFGASGGRLQGAGDAGAEAALPLDEKNLSAIGRGIASTMGGGTEIHLHVDTLIADDMASIDRMNKKLQIGAMKAKNMLGQR
ncbi:phage tail tape measure protein [Listeria booriae]|uniref:phage tail tape measure protein n=1 Tax=Listeria booriae TaxID=1552123 RepID=UPI00164DC80A|nr:phage tail tape measure protein [Listeria booriae]MBC6300299.1 phage tail tape measure protein [Listeria booriae]